MAYTSIVIPATRDWKHTLLQRFGDESHFVLLDSNANVSSGIDYTWIAAGACLKEFTPTDKSLYNLRASRKEHPGWWFGRLNYDLKNQIEKLHSNNDDAFEWTEVRFFLAGWVVTSQNGELTLHLHHDFGDFNHWKGLLSGWTAKPRYSQPVRLTPQMDREAYINQAKSLLQHIHRGDIYEINFCQQFKAKGVEIDALAVYSDLVEVASPPMAAFWHANNEWAISMSPERYLKKRGNRLISQPIKGTAKRSSDIREDQQLAFDLRSSSKEQAENVMILDLVRNDLSRVAERSSVEVTELFGIYSFKTVHQMISTVEANLDAESDIWDAIEASFPMGSMTGAPKVSAMKLIESHENHKRGLYSGAIGYIKPNDDFDFNVVIRTILHDSDKKVVSVSVGSALTSLADPASEWEECNIKLEALEKVLARGSSAGHSD